MTVEELIKELKKIPNKKLSVHYPNMEIDQLEGVYTVKVKNNNWGSPCVVLY